MPGNEDKTAEPLARAREEIAEFLGSARRRKAAAEAIRGTEPFALVLFACTAALELALRAQGHPGAGILPLISAGAALAAAAAVGARAWLALRRTASLPRVAVEADRRLKLEEALSTAFDLARSGERGLFADAVVVRTAAALHATAPGRLYPIRFFRTGWAAGALLMLLIPLSLPRGPADPGPEPALPDRIPPAAITDLKATTGANPGDIRLEWQATGDDGKTGTAHDYRVLQSPDPLTPASAGAASRHSPGWSPRPSGQRERRPLGRLPAGTRTYVALIARDEAGNESPLSNVVEILTPAAGDLVEAGTAGEKGAKPGGNRPAPSPTPDESKAEGKGKGGEGESGGKNPLFGAPERTPAEFEDVKVKPLFGPEGQSRFLELEVPLPRVRGESPGGTDEDTLEMKQFDLLVRYERMAEKAVSAGRIAPNDRKAVLEYFERVKKMVGNGR